VKKHGESNLDVFDVQQSFDENKITNAMTSEPFLGEKRMVVVKSYPPPTDTKIAPATEMFEKTLASIPETTIAVFVSPKPDQRTKSFKFIKNLAQISDFPLLKGRDLGDWARKKLETTGKSIDRAALDLLLLLTGEEMTRISKEIEKLSLLKSPTISEKSIEQVVSPTPEGKIFQVLDSMGKIPLPELLKSFEQLLESEDEGMRVFFMVVRQIRLLVQFRHLLDRKTVPDQIQRRLGLRPFQMGFLSRQARLFQFRKLQKAYAQLAQLDESVKTGKADLPLSLDRWLCSLYE